MQGNLSDWAAIAEIIASLAVIVSLIFLAYNINQNTRVMQTSNDNFVYELQYARWRDIVTSPSLASIYCKIGRGEQLSGEEKERFGYDKLRELTTWELAFNRHRDGQFSTEQWVCWNNYYEISFIDEFPRKSWEEVQHFYMPDFKDHVNSAYEKNYQSGLE